MNQEAGGTCLTVISQKEDAERVREILMENALFDPDRSIGRDDRVHFPVIVPEGRDASWLKEILGNVEITSNGDMTIVRLSRAGPFKTIASLLEESIGQDHLQYLPRKWEMIGDCLVLRVPERLRSYGPEIARAYSRVLGARYVLNDLKGISGELREPMVDVLLPPDDGSFEVIHKEGSARYLLDPSRIMFSSGNTDLRTGFAKIVGSNPVRDLTGNKVQNIGLEGEIVLDMFAGIGYFTIPLALDGSFSRIIAVEKNPVSFEYLKRNIELNGVTDVVDPILGDNRDVSPRNEVDRVLMGYVGGTVDYLEQALDALLPGGGVIHLQDTVRIEDGAEFLFQEAVKRSRGHGYYLSLLGSRRIKSFAPRIDHIMIDILVLPR